MTIASYEYAVYDFTAGNGFTINPTTGYVTVSPFTTIDREARATYNLVIKATDGGTPSPLTATSSLLITVSLVLLSVTFNMHRSSHTRSCI